MKNRLKSYDGNEGKKLSSLSGWKKKDILSLQGAISQALHDALMQQEIGLEVPKTSKIFKQGLPMPARLYGYPMNASHTLRNRFTLHRQHPCGEQATVEEISASIHEFLTSCMTPPQDAVSALRMVNSGQLPKGVHLTNPESLPQQEGFSMKEFGYRLPSYSGPHPDILRQYRNICEALETSVETCNHLWIVQDDEPWNLHVQWLERNSKVQSVRQAMERLPMKPNVCIYDDVYSSPVGPTEFVEDILCNFSSFADEPDEYYIAQAMSLISELSREYAFVHVCLGLTAGKDNVQIRIYRSKEQSAQKPETD